jgi:hypothetical protein
MDRLKFNEMKKSKKRCQICLNDGVGLKRRSLNIFYFEFEYRKHRTIKRHANGLHEGVKVLI